MDVMQRVAIDDLLEKVRTDLDRVRPCDFESEIAAGAVVVDIRPFEQRLRSGHLQGAIVVDRNVLEWRLDHTSPNRLPEATGPDVRYIVVCDEGYSSSLAAASLRQLGLHRATDLIGGYHAWAAWQAAVEARREEVAAARPRSRNRFWHHSETPDGGSPGEAM